MKKILFIFLLSFILCSSDLFARSIAGKVLLAPHGSVGMSLIGGRMPDGDVLPFVLQNDPEMGVGFAFNGGFSIGYAPVDAGAVMLGVEYAEKPFVLYYNDALTGKSTRTIHTAFVDVLMGWKGFVKYFYYEAGLFLGVKIRHWKVNAEFERKSSDRLYGGTYTVPEVNADNDFGVYLGLGASIPLASFVSIDFGIQLQAAWVCAYEWGDNDPAMSTLPLLFKCAFTFYI